ncbi:DNA-directed RNA polymerases I, II, and III subunit RPABC3 [Mycoemilia scoparia]|uniref:DNA-directed RNA polymerases I, II, and III subunit RPABC3 n=1 Tax=Mycoemilia scoparia TaxID=417184 RepID=A0A9W8DJW4_9FUNG|nr:DNA-directed RNA polymerases I, II, and III subunit RPABC3 [Mycoemilia scoparia]
MDKKDNTLFSDIFEIRSINDGGAKFDRVSRISARSENYEMDLILDINNQLYTLNTADKFSLVLASSLGVSGAKDGSTGAAGFSKTDSSWRAVVSGTERSLADDYEYVMYGRIYRYEDSDQAKVSVFISYGGLLMQLTGDYRHLQNLTVGENTAPDGPLEGGEGGG